MPRSYFLAAARAAGRVCMWTGLVWLAGCATQPIPPAADQFLRTGPGHAYFALSGRLSIRDGQRLDIATLRWERSASEESVTLLSPLGSTVARLWKTRDGVARLKSADREATAPDLETLTADALGTTVPLGALSWWVQGLEARSGSGPRASGATFSHDGWEIRIEEFPLSEKVLVAKRIVARKGEVTLRLVIDEWEPRP